MKVALLQRWLIAAALLVRVMFPSGFMLDSARAAIPTLVACDGQGPLFAAGHHHHQQNHHDHGNGDGMHGDCPFSAAAGIALTPSSPDLSSPPAAIAGPAFVPMAIAAYRPAPAAAPPPSTGPPVR